MEFPIRVLHVVVNMNRGGAETLIMNIYRNVDRDKIQFDFLVHKNDGVFEKEITSLGGLIYRIPYITDVGHTRYKKELYNFFAGHLEYKVVHSHMDSMSGLVLQAAKRAGIPVRIAHSHNTQNEGNIPARIYKQYVKAGIAGNATDLFACSEEAAKWLFGKRAEEAFLIKNGVEGARFKFNNETRIKKRNELRIDENKLVVGHVGRFYPQKNHTFLIDIFSDLRKKCSEAVLILVGDGPLVTAIKKKVRNLGLEDSVFFLGSRNDVEELLQAMDVLVFPSHHEGLPLTIVEAQAAGVKCVTSQAVSMNADIGANLLKILSINDATAKWIDEIMIPYERNKEVDVYLKGSGYDIAGTSEQIQVYYTDTRNKLAEGYKEEDTGGSDNGIYTNL